MSLLGSFSKSACIVTPQNITENMEFKQNLNKLFSNNVSKFFSLNFVDFNSRKFSTLSMLPLLRKQMNSKGESTNMPVWHEDYLGS